MRGQRAGRISVRNVFGNRASGTANVALDTEGGVAEGTYSLRGFSRGEFTAELIEPDEDSNEKFQGTWVSDGKLTKDDFVLTLRGNALTLRGRSDQFGTFEFQGQWSAMFNPDFGKASREIKIKGKEIEFETQIGLVPTRVRTPRGVFPFDAVNLPDPLFAFLDPKTNALVVFLGQSDGDLVVTPLIQE
ncbi:MAG: hypothetical protein FJX77_00710 [Armatimonadetes bacterium]|nr:hypothetical protein [Armatimonadota bacterium]